MPHERPARIAMISVHTSPLASPGAGDAGGMNVYLSEVSRQLAAAGTEVDIFTRRSSAELADRQSLAAGVQVHSIGGGEIASKGKNDLVGVLQEFAVGVLERAAEIPELRYDAVHAHYWLSGPVAQAVAPIWNVPIIASMHTLAAAKNLARQQPPEPAHRLRIEQQLVEAADVLVANTSAERQDLLLLTGADPERVLVVPPGVNHESFHPGDQWAARMQLGLPVDRRILLFVGRLQPLKGPDVAIRSVAELVRERPSLRNEVHLVVCGGPSGVGPGYVQELRDLTTATGIAELVEFRPPAAASRLVDLYRSADVLLMPSRSESFGLVALESQAAGTPVVAARVGGLTSSVAPGSGGLLVDGHDPVDWASAIDRLLARPELLAALTAGGLAHASQFDWSRTAAGLAAGYRRAIAGNGVDVVESANYE